ncbi:hypothetical protein BHE74_00017949 [Ensete ventricosum]|nr:hypothetical protein BHE74_00017949 [Ensete ventricosum]
MGGSPPHRCGPSPPSPPPRIPWRGCLSRSLLPLGSMLRSRSESESWESGIDTIVAERDGESEDSVDGEIAQAKNAFLFYPTLVHNLIKNKVEAQFHWWDEVDQKYDPGGSDHAFVYQHLLILLPYRSRNRTTEVAVRWKISFLMLFNVKIGIRIAVFGWLMFATVDLFSSYCLEQFRSLATFLV